MEKKEISCQVFLVVRTVAGYGASDSNQPLLQLGYDLKVPPRLSVLRSECYCVKSEAGENKQGIRVPS